MMSAQNHEKFTLPLVCKMSALAQPSFIQTHHKFRKIRSYLYQKVRTSPQPPLTADILYRQPLMSIQVIIGHIEVILSLIVSCTTSTCFCNFQYVKSQSKYWFLYFICFDASSNLLVYLLSNQLHPVSSI